MKKIFCRKNIHYVLFLCCFTLLVAELSARYYLSNVVEKSSNRKFQFDSYRIYSHIPNFTEGNESGNWITINEQGFRRKSPVEKHKKEGTYRVFFMGGSAAHGISSSRPFPVVHVYDNQTIDAYLEKLLAEKFPEKKIEIINVAVTGYKITQHTPYLLSELLDYDPDMVIFFDGYNDHFNFNVNDHIYRDNIYQYWKPRLQQPSVDGLWDYFALWCSDFSGLARGYVAWKSQKDAFSRYVKLPKPKSKFSSGELIDGYMQVRKSGYLRAVEANLSLLKANEIETIVCLQPGLIFRSEEIRSAKEEGLMEWVTNCSHRPIIYPYIKQDLEKLSNEFQVDFVDMIPEFSKPSTAGKDLFIDYCHLTAEGGELAAEVLLPYVSNYLQPRVEEIDSLTINQ